MRVFNGLFAALLICSNHIQNIWSNSTALGVEDNITALEMEDNSTIIYDYSFETVDYKEFEMICLKASNRSFRSWFLPTIYTLICLLALAGNLLVILTYVYFKRLKTMTDVFLLNLALADLVFAMSLPFWAASVMSKWHLGLFSCKAMFTIYKVSFFSSMFLLTCISVDRYFSITKAISAHRCRNRAVCYGIVSSLVAWLLSVVFSVPDMIFSEVDSNGTCKNNGKSYDDYHVILLLIQMFLGFLLPGFIMSFCYVCIIKTLLQAKNFQRNKAFKVIISVVAVFVFSQLPYNVVMVFTIQDTTDCHKDNRRLYATDVTRAVAFLRCCVNPFLYAFIGVKFRNDLLKLLKELGCIQKIQVCYTHSGRRRSSFGLDTETTTFSP